MKEDQARAEKVNGSDQENPDPPNGQPPLKRRAVYSEKERKKKLEKEEGATTGTGETITGRKGESE